MIIEKQPQQLYKENANGRTPLDIAMDILLLGIQSNVPKLPTWSGYSDRPEGVLTNIHQIVSAVLDVNKGEWDRRDQTFGADHGGASTTYQAILDAVNALPGKRVRASLFESNELAVRYVILATNFS